jgi:hypothetical protein
VINSSEPVTLVTASAPVLPVPPAFPEIPQGAPAHVYEAHLAELHRIYGDTADPIKLPASGWLSRSWPLAGLNPKEQLVLNDTDERIHFASSIEKRIDGTQCFSDHLDPGEELLDPGRTRAADAPSPHPTP